MAKKKTQPKKAPMAKKPAAKPAKSAKPAPKPVKPKAAAKKAPAPAKKSLAPAKAKPAPKPIAKKVPAPVPAKPAPKPVAKPAPPAPPTKPVPAPTPVVAAPAEPPAPKPPAPSLKMKLDEVPKPEIPAGVPLTVTAQGAPGAASSGNTQPANLLVLVTCAGWPVADLTEDHFTIMEHFDVPGQMAPFSNNIVNFRNAGSGAYLIQVRPISGAAWRGGHHLAQILVSSPDDRQGQAAAKIIVR